MFLGVPSVERRTLGGIGDGGADDEEVVGHRENLYGWIRREC
jgi:hypothetical protein